MAFISSSISSTASRLLTAASVVALAALSACGGGGDDDKVSTSNASTAALTPYAGRWQAPCLDRTDAATVANSNPTVYLSVSTEFELHIANGRLEGTRTERLHNDDNCRSVALATHSSAISATNDGAVTVQSPRGNGVGIQTTFTLAASLPGMSGRTITINGITYINTNNLWTQPRNVKTLFHVSGNKLFFGDDEPVDAQGYPTVITLDDDEAWIKL